MQSSSKDRNLVHSTIEQYKTEISASQSVIETKNFITDCLIKHCYMKEQVLVQV